MKKKSARKSGKRAPGKPFQPGPDPRRGRGPAKGASNAGRPPKAFTQFMTDLRHDDKVQKQFELTAKDRNSRHYGMAIKLLSEYDDELPANLTPEERAARARALLEKAAERRAAAGS